MLPSRPEEVGPLASTMTSLSGTWPGMQICGRGGEARAHWLVETALERARPGESASKHGKPCQMAALPPATTGTCAGATHRLDGVAQVQGEAEERAGVVLVGLGHSGAQHEALSACVELVHLTGRGEEYEQVVSG